MNYRESLLQLLATVDPLRVVAEIGVHRGRTSAAILDRFKDVTLYMVDPWEPYRDGEREVTAEQQRGFREEAFEETSLHFNRRIIVETDSIAALSHVPTCDVVFIDGNHSYEFVWPDMAWWENVRPGGLFAGHDFGKPDIPGVTLAVNEFAAERGLTMNVAEGNIWWIIRSHWPNGDT